jgi:hypothetical protein
MDKQTNKQTRTTIRIEFSCLFISLTEEIMNICTQETFDNGTLGMKLRLDKQEEEEARTKK